MNLAYEDIKTFTDLGPRETGSEQEKQAAHIINQRLESFGYEVSLQSFNLPAVMGGTLTIDGQSVDIQIVRNSPTTNEEGLTALLYDAELGKAEDFTEEAKGKIALISRGEITFQEKVTNANNAGATAVIIYNNVDGTSPLSYSATTSIPAVGISKADGLTLKGLSGNEATLTTVIESQPTSSNIIATKYPENSTDRGDIVYVSAHFDSVPGADGANDNASGTAAALELARILKDVPSDKELRFVFVGAEEIGLVGSNYYVETLTEEEVNRSIANFNMDMVATAWEPATAIYTNTLDGKANIVTTTANKVAKIIGTPSELVLFERGASDHVGFHNVGIPAANFIRREPGTHKLEPSYHTPEDTIDKISKERLKEIIELVGGSVYTVMTMK